MVCKIDDFWKIVVFSAFWSLEPERDAHFFRKKMLHVTNNNCDTIPTEFWWISKNWCHKVKNTYFDIHGFQRVLVRFTYIISLKYDILTTNRQNTKRFQKIRLCQGSIHYCAQKNIFWILIVINAMSEHCKTVLLDQNLRCIFGKCRL